MRKSLCLFAGVLSSMLLSNSVCALTTDDSARRVAPQILARSSKIPQKFILQKKSGEKIIGIRWDNSGRILETNLYDENYQDSPARQELYTYEGSHLVSFEVVVGAGFWTQSELKREYIYEHDKLVSMKHSAYKRLIFSTAFEYDQAGVFLKATSTAYDANDIVSSVDELSYNKATGLLTEKTRNSTTTLEAYEEAPFDIKDPASLLKDPALFTPPLKSPENTCALADGKKLFECNFGEGYKLSFAASDFGWMLKEKNLDDGPEKSKTLFHTDLDILALFAQTHLALTYGLLNHQTEDRNPGIGRPFSAMKAVISRDVQDGSLKGLQYYSQEQENGEWTLEAEGIFEYSDSP